MSQNKRLRGGGQDFKSQTFVEEASEGTFSTLSFCQIWGESLMIDRHTIVKLLERGLPDVYLHVNEGHTHVSGKQTFFKSTSIYLGLVPYRFPVFWNANNKPLNQERVSV